MEINDSLPSIFKPESCSNSNLYSFLATNYDISSLAKGIVASKMARLNIINLKKCGNMTV